jgi:hypothetical protein
LPVLCSNHVFACGPRDCSAAGATQISLISLLTLLSCSFSCSRSCSLEHATGARRD